MKLNDIVNNRNWILSWPPSNSTFIYKSFNYLSEDIWISRISYWISRRWANDKANQRSDMKRSEEFWWLTDGQMDIYNSLKNELMWKFQIIQFDSHLGPLELLSFDGSLCLILIIIILWLLLVGHGSTKISVWNLQVQIFI